MNRNLRIEDVSLTDTGLARSENEDCHVSLPQQQVWLVADGMGGHDNGRFASQVQAPVVFGQLTVAVRTWFPPPVVRV